MNDLQEAILDILDEEMSMAISDVLEKVQEVPGLDDVSMQRLGPTMSAMAKRGLIKKLDSGFWSIATGGEDVLRKESEGPISNMTLEDICRAEDTHGSQEFKKQDRYLSGFGEDWIEEFAKSATPEEFRGAMKFTIGKYLRRVGKKDPIPQELEKIEDYCRRWREYELQR